MNEAEPIRLTRAQVREVDRLAVEKYHVPSIVLMENAARTTAEVILARAQADALKRALIVCGGGNNGGDGLAIARHLHNRSDLTISIALAIDPTDFRDDALINWRIVEAMKLPVIDARRGLPDAQASILVDAMFGTGLSRAPAEPFRTIITQMNELRRPIVAVDVPSGLDCDTGEPPGACIRAAATVTFVAEKVGFAHPAAKQYLGEVTVGDIGCPRELIAEVVRDMR